MRVAHACRAAALGSFLRIKLPTHLDSPAMPDNIQRVGAVTSSSPPPRPTVLTRPAMNDPPVKSKKEPAWRRLSSLPLLTSLGLATLGLLLIAGILRMFGPPSPSQSNVANDLGMLSLYIAIGLACAGLLIGLSLVLRVLRDLHSALIRVERYQYEIGVTAPPPAPPSAPRWRTSLGGDGRPSSRSRGRWSGAGHHWRRGACR